MTDGPVTDGPVTDGPVTDGPVPDVLALTVALRAAALSQVLDLVPAARTVLVHTVPDADITRLGSVITEIAAATDPATTVTEEPGEVLIQVRYDGPDLDEVAALTGLSRAEVIARHTGTRWRAAFVGFAPGFAYLAGGDHGLDVPRRADSRTSVPAGSVALAGGYSAVYPQESPGGWQLIGSTDARLWSVDRDPPALIGPGTRVRFRDIGQPDGAEPTGEHGVDTDRIDAGAAGGDD